MHQAATHVRVGLEDGPTKATTKARFRRLVSSSSVVLPVCVPFHRLRASDDRESYGGAGGERKLEHRGGVLHSESCRSECALLEFRCGRAQRRSTCVSQVRETVRWQ